MTDEASVGDDSRNAATVAIGTDPSPPATATITRGSTFDRYVVLDMIGRGGMGLVARAYDPKLQREVALKLLRADARGGKGPEASARLVREAQAMARLGHPNVVTVFDAGEVDGQVYLAMELVRGQTLRRWLETDHPWRVVLSVLREAGAGLVAAHAAGLVHRDFKPDNVLIGDADERVRVTDFGIARGVGSAAPSNDEPPIDPPPPADASSSEHLTEAGTVLGTPPYMAPEQHRGEPADARADQYAWCVTAWEALAGRRPFVTTGAELVLEKARWRTVVPARTQVPTWVWNAIGRGLDPDPDRRWPSMAALLAAIGQDASRKRQRRIGIAVVAILGAGLLASYSVSRSRARSLCRDEADASAAHWSDADREHLRASVLAVPAGYAAATWEKLQPWLDDYAAAWARLRETQCLASEIDGTRTQELRRLGDECLDERLAAFSALVEALGDADEVALREAIPSAAKLPAIDACADDARLARRLGTPGGTVDAGEVAAVRAALRRADIQLSLGRYAVGLEIARTASDRAASIGWEPLVAEARARVGLLASKIGDGAAAERELLEAFLAAGRSGHDDMLARTAIDLTYHVGYASARSAEGLLWAKIGEMALVRAGDTEGLLRAELLSATGSVHLRHGERDEAIVLYQHSLAIRERLLGSEHPEVATGLTNLGAAHQIAGRPADALPLLERGLEIHERTLGADHPGVAIALNNVAAGYHAVGDFTRARALQQRALDIFERALGPDHPDVALGLHNLATLAEIEGDLDGAVALYRRALAIQERTVGADHPDVAMALHNLAQVNELRGRTDEALAQQRRAVEIFERTQGPDHPDLASALQALGMMYASRGDLDRAVQLQERVLAISAAHDRPGDPRLADARFRLAEALWRSGRDRDRARELASDAAKSLRAAGPSVAAQLAEVDAWLQRTAGDR